MRRRRPSKDTYARVASTRATRARPGRPTTITDPQGQVTTLTYDESGNILTATRGALTMTYRYDAQGRRLFADYGRGVTVRYEYAGPTDEWTAIEGPTFGRVTRRFSTGGRGGADLATYTYDDAGRVLTRRYDTRDQTLSWDADDHVVALSEGTTELTYDFDPAGRRVRREERIAGTVVDVDSWQVAPTGVDELESPHLETDDTGAQQRAWVFAGEHPLLRYDPTTGDVVYYLSDAMGSVIGLVDDAGAVGTVHYDGFGNERVVSGSIAAVADEGDFRFQGMWLDGDSGLYYVRARVYESESGRFLSRDPAEGVRTGADTYWTYAFAGHNPWIFVDPTGAVAFLMGDIAVRNILATIAIATIGTGFLRGLRAARDVDEQLSGGPLDRFGQCIEQNTVDAAIAGSSLLVAGPFVPLSKAVGIALGIIDRRAALVGGTRLTSPASILLHQRIAQALLSQQARIGLRTASRGLSAVLTPILVAEGFYDVGLIAGCAALLVE